MGVVYGLFVVAFLIAVNALYVAAEFGAVSARRSRIRVLAEEGHWIAKRLAPVLADPLALDRWISACQIGITLSSLVLGAYGEAKLAPMLAPVLADITGISARSAMNTSVAIVLGALTILQMFFGELVPKSIALQYPTQSALYTALPIRWSMRVFSVFLEALNNTSRALLALCRIHQPEHRHVHSPEEIELLISESSSGGMLEPEEREQLRRALRLGMRDVRQMMVPRSEIEAIDVSATKEEILHVINGPYTRVPVYRSRFDAMIGVLHAKDVVVNQLETGTIAPVEQLMRPLLAVRENARAGEVLSQLREHKTRVAIVRDRAGYVVGLVTLEDVLAAVFGTVPADEGLRAKKRRATLPPVSVKVRPARRK